MAGKKDKQHWTDTKKLTDEQLVAELTELRTKLYTLRTQTVTEKVEDISQFRKIRANIARLMTEASVRRHVKSPKRLPKAAPAVATGPRSVKMTEKRPGGAKKHKPKRVSTKPAAKAAK